MADCAEIIAEMEIAGRLNAGENDFGRGGGGGRGGEGTRGGKGGSGTAPVKRKAQRSRVDFCKRSQTHNYIHR